jgi:hypothetical protein
MEGEVYFGAVAHVEEQLHDLRAPLAAPKHLLVMSKSMNFIDLAAAEMWKKELRARRTPAATSTSTAARAGARALAAVGFLGELGTDHVFPAKQVAIATIFDRSTAASAPTARCACSRNASGCRRRWRRSPEARTTAAARRFLGAAGRLSCRSGHRSDWVSQPPPAARDRGPRRRRSRPGSR